MLARAPQNTKLSIQVNFQNRYVFGDFGKIYGISPLATSTTVLCIYMPHYGLWLGDGGRTSFCVTVLNGG